MLGSALKGAGRLAATARSSDTARLDAQVGPVFTLVKEGGNLFITGSINFNRYVSSAGKKLLSSMFY